MTETTLADLVEPGRKICYGIVQPGSPKADGVPVLRVNNFGPDGLSTDDVLRIDPAVEEEYPRSRLRGGELLVTLVGSIGQSTIAPPNVAGWNVARAVGVVPIADPTLTKWACYVVRSAPAQRFFGQRANTTVQTTLNLRDLALLPVPLLPRAKLEAVIAVLSALDAKIELNRRMNETLEAQARALFRDWFVDFGPVKAKIAGDAPYLAPDLWSLFCDRLDDDGVPEGWRRSTIGESFHLTMGQSPPGETYNDEGSGLPFFQGRTDFGFRYPENRKFCDAPTRVAEKDDTLVSVRAPVGDINMAWEKCCIGRGVSALRHKSGSASFTYYSAAALRAELEVFEHTGTVFGAINKKQFEALPTIEPDARTLAAFDSIVGPIDVRIRLNNVESRTLIQTRDLLLPRLMSGEIGVSLGEQPQSQAL